MYTPLKKFSIVVKGQAIPKIVSVVITNMRPI
jgi:hypothetical protein